MSEVEKKQMQIVLKEITLLDKKAVESITGWGENTVNYIFAKDMEFPAIKIGKKYQVEVSALKQYLQKRRVKDDKK